jgi:hypothetical protein
MLLDRYVRGVTPSTRTVRACRSSEAFVSALPRSGNYANFGASLIVRLYTSRSAALRVRPLPPRSLPNSRRAIMAVLRSIDDLELLPRDTRVNGLVRRERIAFDISQFGRREQLRWEESLNRYQSRCGCVAGAVCLLVTLVAAGSYIATNTATLFSPEFLGNVVLVLLLSIAAGVAGKFAALEITRFQFARACLRVRREIVARQNEGRALTV